MTGAATVPIQELADRWLATLAREGRAANTVQAYRFDIAQYVRHLDAVGVTDVHRVVQGHVERFVQDFAAAPGRTGRPRADSTVARVVSAVRMFHRWLHDVGVTVEDAAAGVPPPHAVRATPAALDRTDVAQLVSSVDGDGPIALRDRAVLSLLVATGVTTGELVALDLRHVADDVTALDVPGDRARPLPITDGRALRQWLAVGHAAMAGGTPALFPNARGQRMSRQGVWRLVSERAVAAGLPAGTSPRTLRNTFAALEREAGTPEQVVLELLGRVPWTGAATSWTSDEAEPVT